MNLGFDLLIVVLVLTNLRLLGASRLAPLIQTVAFQGVALGLLPLLTEHSNPTLASALLNMTSVLLKGLVFPWLLFRALKVAAVKREVEPFVGYTASLFFGILALAFGCWIVTRLPLPERGIPPHLLAAAIFTMLTGLFLIVTRRKALTQVAGYLVLENGIATFGLVLVHHTFPLLVELGILLDVFVAVFVMGIIIFHISREFDHIDTDRLAVLKD